MIFDMRWRRNCEFQARPHHKMTARLLIKRSVSKNAYLRWYLLVRKTTWLGLGSSQPKCYGSRLRHAKTLEGLRPSSQPEEKRQASECRGLRLGTLTPVNPQSLKPLNPKL